MQSTLLETETTFAGAAWSQLVPPTLAARKLAAAHEAELHLLTVDPSWRGRGVGTGLVSTVGAAARQQGYRGLILWT